MALALTLTAATAITSRCRSKGGAICRQTLPHYPGQFQWRACRALRAAQCVCAVRRWADCVRRRTRFALTSSTAQLESAGRLAHDYPDVFIHSHLAENRDEVETVRKLFPHDRSYLDVYDRVGLLRERATYARNLAERLLLFMVLGDDRAIAETFILGQAAPRRPGNSANSGLASDSQQSSP